MGQNNFQETILNTLRKEHQLTTVYLLSGLPIKCHIRAYDNFVIVAETQDGKQMMIYKHAIASIAPSKSVRYDGERSDEREE